MRNVFPCRVLKSQEAVLSSWNTLCAQITASLEEDKSRAGILSLTIARQKKDVTPVEFRTITELLKRLHETGVITDGAGASEKGDGMNHVHLQCMLWLPEMNVDHVKVQHAIAELVYIYSDIPRHSNWHVYAETHWPDDSPNIRWKTMCGCENPSGCTVLVMCTDYAC